MTNAAHTPGPWDFDNYADHVSYFSPARKDDYVFRIDFPDDMPEAEAEANARLIAAAPRLLKELERMLGLYVARLQDDGCTDEHISTMPQIIEPRAAIGEAQGG